jgi:serine protease
MQMTRALFAVACWLIASSAALGQLRYLPAEPPQRKDAVVAGHLKVRVASAYAPVAREVLHELGLRIVREILPYEQSLRGRDAHNSRHRAANLEEALALEDRLLRSYVVAYDQENIAPERMMELVRIGCGPIECAAPWCVMELCAEPNDPEVPKQSMLKLIRATQAWDVEDGSDSVIIGISDSGVRQDHEDLNDALFIRTSEIPDNNIDDDNNGYVDDYDGFSFSAKADGVGNANANNPFNGHGTSVAGICAARVNNSIGIAGVANTCKIFPLRTMPNGTSGIVYGYESIMYCATNGIHVVNCSWGGQSRSCIDEDVVAYAIARGTAVVAAAGNHGSASPFYPAAYSDVLSVGVVDASDNVVPMSGHGPAVDIMAPGHGSWSTANDGTYAGFCCTSGSAPIVSAVVALVRSRHPELGPVEACAVVRATATPSPWASIPASIDPLLLPQGRVDALSAVTASPDTLVSVVLDSVIVRGPRQTSRWTVGDTIEVRIRLRNDLAPIEMKQMSNIRLTGDVSRGIELVDNQSFDLSITADKGQLQTLPPIQFVVTRKTDTATFAVVTLSGTCLGKPFQQVLSAPITPSKAYTTLSNQRLRVSIGDRGRIGNTDLQRGQGEGLTFDTYCGQLYECGYMVSANGRVVDNVRAERGTNDHFRSIKGYMLPNPELGVMQDLDAPDSVRIGIQIEQRVALDSARGLLIVDATVTNVSDSTLNDLALGWFSDWDLGSQPADNWTYTKNNAQITRSGSGPIVAQFITSAWTDATVILHGMDNTTTYNGFAAARKFRLLRALEAPFAGITDVATVVGVRFAGPLPPNHVRNFKHVIVMDTTEAGLFDRIEIAAKALAISTVSPWVVDPIGEIFPNPATGYINVPVDGMGTRIDLSIADAQGRLVLQLNSAAALDRAIVPVDTESLGQGMYVVSVTDGTSRKHLPLVIRR